MLFESPTIAGLLDVLCRDLTVRGIIERASDLYLEVVALSEEEVEQRFTAAPTQHMSTSLEEV
jgi:hypothetical protein